MDRTLPQVIDVASKIMIQGTASSVGKSVIAAALCRIFYRAGIDVAPFKAQNMSNNSFATAGGGEIGRAQVVQAIAAGVEPTIEMNPVLLKPEADHRSQILIWGHPSGHLSGENWVSEKPRLWEAAKNALDFLLAQYALVVIEGAGSPAEPNLKDGDIVNMRIALHARSPVILVGDIDRGGVFGSLLGTLELLEPDERRLVKGLIINRFRGTREILEPLPSMIEERTGVPVIGVVPFVQDLRLPEEDATALERASAYSLENDSLRVIVVRLPRVSNFDDFMPLAMTESVSLIYATEPSDLDGAHLLVLPGTKSTLADLRWLRARGLDSAIVDAARNGTMVIGICGGYQMLGRTISDLDGVEGECPESVPGLGLLPVQTDFQPGKTTRQVNFKMNGGNGLLTGAAGVEGAGYEIHMGETRPVKGECPAPAQYIGQAGSRTAHGAISHDGRVLGTYVHGLFDSPTVRGVILENAAAAAGLPPPQGKRFSIDSELDRLADIVQDALDMPYIRSLIAR